MLGHETLLAWQQARLVALMAYKLTARIWNPDLAVPIDQLRRSSLSVRLNIAEGYALQSNGQLRRHLTVAYGSAVEAVDTIEFIRELSPTNSEELDLLATEGRRSCRLVLGYKRSVEKRAPDSTRA